MILTIHRIVALTPQVFFVKWYNIIDFMVVLITFIIAIAAATTDGEWAEKLAILTLFRYFDKDYVCNASQFCCNHEFVSGLFD